MPYFFRWKTEEDIHATIVYEDELKKMPWKVYHQNLSELNTVDMIQIQVIGLFCILDSR